LNNIPHIAWIKDSESRFIAVNEPLAQMLNCSRSEMIGKTDYDFSPEEIAHGYQKDDFKVLASGQRKVVEERAKGGDGSWRWLETTKTPFRDAQGQLAGTVGIAADISDRKQAELALEQEVLRRNVIFNTVSDGIHILDKAGNLIEANESFARMLGYSLSEIADFNVVDWDVQLSRKETESLLQQDKLDDLDEQPFFETLHRRKDGSVFPVEISRCKLEWNGQEALIAISRDISERKQAEEQIRRSMAQLEASNNELESFAYSISHDLRAPLRAINGFSQALLEDYGDLFDDYGRDYFNRIQANANRMGKLIDDLLQLSRLSRSELNYTTVDLSTFAQEVLDDLKKSDPDRQVESMVRPEVIVFGDAALMQVVLMNLLQNAWKFTSHHPTAHIEFGILPETQESSEPVYFVKDNGAGFDMTYGHKLFGVFQRLHSVQEFPGTGIGLASVRRAIHRHGGQIWAEATVEVGATFFFTVPSTVFPTSMHG
jgi:PAS domain S-box-containing protein